MWKKATKQKLDLSFFISRNFLSILSFVFIFVGSYVLQAHDYWQHFWLSNIALVVTTLILFLVLPTAIRWQLYNKKA